MSNAQSALPISQADMDMFRDKAEVLMTQFVYTPGKTLARMLEERKLEVDKTKMPEKQFGYATSVQENVKALDALTIVNGKSSIFKPMLNTIAYSLQQGMMMGLHVAGQYERQTNLAAYSQLPTGTQLTLEQQAELRGKRETAAAVALSVACRYALWHIEQSKFEVSGGKGCFEGLPEEIRLSSTSDALTYLMYHWVSYVKYAQSELEVAIVTKTLLSALIADIAIRAGSFRFADQFADTTYELRDTRFSFSGFKQVETTTVARVEFERTHKGEIIGNHDAKRFVLRVCDHIFAYSFDKKRNPLAQFGALPYLFVLQGSPGTGKSMMLRLMQTVVKDRCDALGIPFVLSPIPGDLISSLQGESAVRYMKWYATQKVTDAIVLAPVDDAEAIYLSRQSQSSSEGSKLIVQSHLGLTEGSTAVNYGNVLQPHATNNADLIDPAVFSRYMARKEIMGAESEHDFMDQMRQWGDKFNTQAGKPVIDLEWKDGYVHMSDQNTLPILIAADEKRAEDMKFFQNSKLNELWDSLGDMRNQRSTYVLYGRFFQILKKRYPNFTSRDMRNVQINATSRMFGFDFPQEWFENPDTFVKKSYDEKSAMIIEMGLQLAGGINPAEIVFEEMVRYTDATISLLDSGRTQRIRKLAESMSEQREAAELATTL
jgi:ATPase family associated with various cellular activities (AAA)